MLISLILLQATFSTEKNKTQQQRRTEWRGAGGEPSLLFPNDSRLIFNENDANCWVLTQDEFLFDELHAAFLKTWPAHLNTRKCGVMQQIGGEMCIRKIIATKIFSVSLLPS